MLTRESICGTLYRLKMGNVATRAQAAKTILAEMDEPLAVLAGKNKYDTEIYDRHKSWLIVLRHWDKNGVELFQQPTYVQAEQAAREYLLKLEDQNKGE